MSDELDNYLSAGYKKPSIDNKKVKPMATTVREPVSKTTSTTSTKSGEVDSTKPAGPFMITSGVKLSQRWLNIFIYGDYGSGKTVISAQSVDVPSMRDVLFINIESGITSIVGSKAVVNHESIDFVNCTKFEEFVAVHRMLIAYCQARDDGDTDRIKKMAEKYGFNPDKRYRTVIIDSLSELNQISLSRAFGEDNNDLLSTTSSDDTRRDFGRNKSAMLKVIRAFRNLPMHVIATCGRQWDEDERKKLGYQPRLTGALAKEVQSFWDVVGFMQTGAAKKDEDEENSEPSIKRILWLQPIGKFDAKNRLSSQDVTHIENPTMSKLVKLLSPQTTDNNNSNSKALKKSTG